MRAPAHTRPGSSWGSRVTKVGLIVGFLAFGLAALRARAAPATGYEVSIYAATPRLVWVGLGVAVVTGIVSALASDRGLLSKLGGALVGLSIALVASLPFIRGYFFLGAGDGLTHLGWARSLSTGAMEPWELLYPGVHSIGVAVSSVFGLELSRALVFTVVAFVAVFLLFLPLCAALVSGSRRGLLVGSLVAALLLPITNVSTHVSVHPSSQAIMFLPFLLYLTFAYTTGVLDPPDSPVGTGTLLAVAGGALLLIHPQETMSFLLVLGAFVALQLSVRRLRSDDPLATHRSLLPHSLFVGGIFLAWSSLHERTRSRVVTVVASIREELTPGTEVQQYSSSIADVGGSLPEMFVKLFGPESVVLLFAGLFAVATILGRPDDVFPEDNALNKYLVVSLVPLGVAFLVMFVADQGDHYFRFLGTIMVFVSLLGSAALGEWLPARLPSGSGRPYVVGVVLLFLVLTPLAAVTIHPSPFIYQSTAHVTESEYGGYQTAFEVRAPGIEFTGVRGKQERFVHAVYGPDSEQAATFPGPRDAIPTNRTVQRTDEPRYITLSERDRTRELETFDGITYSRASIEGYRGDPRYHSVVDSGEFRLYLSQPDTR